MSEEEGGRRREARDRLQKILSQAGVASRRLAEELIVQGRVQINGVTVTALGSRADPDTDEIKVDGRRIQVRKRKRYILLHKPRGYITCSAACATTSIPSAGSTTTRKGCCC
jgi:16S rRNA U516 pseudouridylate synthase RsuA-like enzyme